MNGHELKLDTNSGLHYSVHEPISVAQVLGAVFNACVCCCPLLSCGIAVLEVCMAAVLVGVMRLLGCPFDGAWRLVSSCAFLAVVCFDCRCSLSFVFPGGAR